MNPCHHSPSFPPPTLAPPICHAPSLRYKHTQRHKHSPFFPKFILFSDTHRHTGSTAIEIKKSFRDVSQTGFRTISVWASLRSFTVALPSSFPPFFFLEVTQNAIRVNEKPANSIMEANENGTGDSALKAGWAHPNKPSSVTGFPASKLTRGPSNQRGQTKESAKHHERAAEY